MHYTISDERDSPPKTEARMLGAGVSVRVEFIVRS